MPIVPGFYEIMMLIPIALWTFGLPLLVIYAIYRFWKRLGAIERELQELREQVGNS